MEREPAAVSKTEDGRPFPLSAMLKCGGFPRVSTATDAVPSLPVSTRFQEDWFRNVSTFG